MAVGSATFLTYLAERQLGEAARRSQRSRFLIQAYLLALPLSWALGIDFLLPVLLAVALISVSVDAHRRFTLSDILLAGIILTLGAAAYVNGFLVSRETTRFLAALYNMSIWVCGLIIVQQVRCMIERSEADRQAVLRTAFWAFLLMAAFAWGYFISAYAVGRFALELPSLFGLVFGGVIPESAPLIRGSTSLVFTQPDWGLPGVPMPRVAIYGPYPAATAATAAVLGTLALLHLEARRRIGAWAVVAFEGVILLTLAVTLTRSILAGWLLGAIAANLAFGTAWRRIAACGAVAGAVLVVASIDMSDAVSYRAYSSESRFENYVRAVDQTLMANPVFGLGIKPREKRIHIAVGSHSTFVSAFTKGGAIGLSFVFAYLVLLPAARWFSAVAPAKRLINPRTEMRILLQLQVAIWVWLLFEDIDAPATAAMLIFMGFAFIDSALRSPRSTA